MDDRVQRSPSSGSDTHYGDNNFAALINSVNDYDRRRLTSWVAYTYAGMQRAQCLPLLVVAMLGYICYTLARYETQIQSW